MRTLTALTALAVASLPLAAQQPGAEHPKTTVTSPRDAMSGQASGKRMMAHDSSRAAAAMRHEDKDRAVAGGGTLPAGWSGRTDGAASALAQVKFAPMGPGMHLTLGPATILYRESDRVSGPFHTLATFTQTKAPTHPEGYGLFFGGEGLNDAGQKYVYFLVRGDGKFLIKRRDGANTSVVKDWTESSAIVKADPAGKATNRLEIDGSQAGKVTFKINGQDVYSMVATPADLNGAIGIRANHNLDLHIAGFAVHRM